MERIPNFIVLEGTDGSGKSVQFEMLHKRLKREGFSVATFDFPQHGKPSAFFVDQYLTGRYGGWKEVGPYRASVFYALDRYDIAPKLRLWAKQLKRWPKRRKVMLSNRYVPSNMGHQGSKIVDDQKRLFFFSWVTKFEYGILGIPRPMVSIILHVPAKIAYALVAKKGKREYLHKKKRDIHEADIKHIRRAEKAYLQMALHFPKDFKLIECVEKGKLLSPEEIHERVWKVVRRRLLVR